MPPKIDRLLEIGSDPIHPGSPTIAIFNDTRAVPLENELAALLTRRNGVFAFMSALQIFPADTQPGSIGLADWNEPGLWKAAYEGLAENLLCFAQDVFGNQFAIAGSKVVLFKVETGEIDDFATSLEDWASKLLDDYDYLSGYTFAKQWQEKNGPLGVGSRLCPIKPFIIGGAYELSNLRFVDAVKLMNEMGDLARQIHGQPDGTRIRLLLKAP